MSPNIVIVISIIGFICDETRYKLLWRNACRKRAYALAVYVYLKP
jgi:hypothetical protein